MRGSLLFYEIGIRCNLACPFCIAEAQYSRNVNGLPTKVGFARFNSVITSLRSLGFGRLIVTGGEPLLYQELWDMLARATDLGFATSIITNGVLVPEYLQNLRKANLSEVIVSFESLDEHTNRKLRTNASAGRKAVELCLAADVPVSINAVIAPQNVTSLIQMVRWADDRGVKVALHPVAPMGRHAALFSLDNISDAAKVSLIGLLQAASQLDQENAAAHEAIIQRFVKGAAYPRPAGACHVPLRSAALFEDGTLSPCFNHSKPYGNVCSEGWEIILQRMNERISMDSPEFESCWSEKCFGLVYEDYRLEGGELRLF